MASRLSRSVGEIETAALSALGQKSTDDGRYVMTTTLLSLHSRIYLTLFGQTQQDPRIIPAVIAREIVHYILKYIGVTGLRIQHIQHISDARFLVKPGTLRAISPHEHTVVRYLGPSGPSVSWRTTLYRRTDDR